MNSEQNRKRLERQARSLILAKDISLEDRDKINSLMRNQSIPHDERYTSIINILKKSPDKEISEIEDEEEPVSEVKTPVKVKRDIPSPSVKREAVSVYSAAQAGGRKFPDINGPTETKLYINEIFLKFKKYKLFKKKYLVRRDNRIGYGWSKRLIPAKKLITLMNDIRFFQESILSRLPQILEQILKDESVESPLEFNYLRQLRRWMIISPFSSLPYEKIKWMQQWDFEREIRAYVINFHSFIRIDAEQREQVLALVEKFLREEPDLIKEEIVENEERSISIRKENDNYRKEKAIFEYLGALRSFMAIHGESDSFVAAFLKKKYDIYTLEELINMILEALVFQRPFAPSELREYFEIRTLTVSADTWDLSSARLKQYGKDPESKRIKQAARLQKELLWYDTIHQIVKVDDNGQNILVNSVEEQWKYVDRVNRDPEDSLKNNFMVFLEGVTHYFRNLMIPVLSGKPLIFDYFGETVEGAIFSHDYFFEEIREIELLIADIYNFRNVNPTLKVTDEEIKKIVAGKLSSMNHVEGIVFKTGSSFYALGRKLHEVYHNHIKAMEKNTRAKLRTSPINPEERDTEVQIPYSTCLFKGFEPSTPLLRRIAGRKILSDTMKGGIVIFIMAYCYQTAALCGYPQIRNDLARRDIIRKEIKDLKGDSDDTKR